MSRRSDIIAMFRLGVIPSQIAQKVGVSRARVSQILTQEKMAPGRRKAVPKSQPIPPPKKIIVIGPSPDVIHGLAVIRALGGRGFPFGGKA